MNMNEGSNYTHKFSEKKTYVVVWAKRINRSDLSNKSGCSKQHLILYVLHLSLDISFLGDF
jgi:hypothetical protein